MSEQAAATADNVPAKPIRMYVVETLYPNGDIEVSSIELDERRANELAKYGNTPSPYGRNDLLYFVRPALLHYERPQDQRPNKTYMSQSLLDTDIRWL